MTLARSAIPLWFSGGRVLWAENRCPLFHITRAKRLMRTPSLTLALKQEEGTR